MQGVMISEEGHLELGRHEDVVTLVWLRGMAFLLSHPRNILVVQLLLVQRMRARDTFSVQTLTFVAGFFSVEEQRHTWGKDSRCQEELKQAQERGPEHGGRVFFFKGLAKRFFLKGLAEPSVDFELQQAIGEGLFAGSSFAASYWGRTIRRVFFCSKLLGKDYPQGLLLQQAIGEGLTAGSSFAASYWGRTIRRVFFCSKLLAKVHS